MLSLLAIWSKSAAQQVLRNRHHADDHSTAQHSMASSCFYLLFCTGECSRYKGDGCQGAGDRTLLLSRHLDQILPSYQAVRPAHTWHESSNRHEVTDTCCCVHETGITLMHGLQQHSHTLVYVKLTSCMQDQSVSHANRKFFNTWCLQ